MWRGVGGTEVNEQNEKTTQRRDKILLLFLHSNPMKGGRDNSFEGENARKDDAP